MATEFKLPELGENIETAEILKVSVSEGDVINVDDVVLEIETDKATVEVPSDVSGKITKVHVKDGDTAKVGDTILTIEESGESSGDSEPAKEEETSQPAEEDKQEETEEKEEPKEEKQASETKAEKSGGSSTYEFKLPELGENINSAEVLKVLVKEGDSVNEDDPVLEIETDKATVEVPVDVSGTIKEVKIKEGESAKVGSTVLVLETGGGASKSSSEEAQKKEEKTEEKKEAKKEQEPGKKKEESPKEEKPEPQLTVEPADTTHKARQYKNELPEKIAPASPSVRRFAREIGVDIHQVSGSGPGGRISIEDVKAFAKNLNEKLSKSGSGAVIGVSAEPLPDFTKWGEVEREKMSNIRKKTAEHLSYAWSVIPHVTQFEKADITELEKIRKQFKGLVEAAGAKLTPTAILLKVVAAALKQFPQFNASIDMDKKEVIYKKYYNVGVAVDTDRGLLVPVIRDVDKKNIVQLSIELGEMAKKARDKKLGLDDMQGGNFSISNLGGIGGTYFTPIVNSPEVAILGVSKGNYEPVYQDGQFVPRLMMPLSLSYDHRIIDGADAIRFLRWVVDALENPFKLILEG